MVAEKVPSPCVCGDAPSSSVVVLRSAHGHFPRPTTCRYPFSPSTVRESTPSPKPQASMPISETEKNSASWLLSQFCETRIPPHVRDQIELGFRFEGNVVYLFERRPNWRGSGEWTSMDIARFRYFVGRGEWVLYWSDRNQIWHRYDLIGDWLPFRRLLKEVDEDPTCIFWG